MEKKKFFNRLIVFVLLQIGLAIIFMNSYVVEDTKSRYIEQAKDQIRAHYTALYFDSSISSATLALENDVAYINFDLMNFIGEDVTKHDIEYVITKPAQFYDNKGNPITPNGTNDLYVLDVWNQPQQVGNDTYKYETEIVENTGEKVEGTNAYKFTYETVGGGTEDENSEVNGGQAIGKTHNVTVKITRTDSSTFITGEKISVVIKLNNPYEEVLIIDFTILDTLITFSNSSGTIFETEFEKMQIQTANIFSYQYSEENSSYVPRLNPQDNNEAFTSYGFKVTLVFDNLVLDRNSLDQLHMENDGGTPSNIDITKPYILSVENTGTGGTIVMYVPEASSFDFNFLQIDLNKDYLFKVQVEVYLYNKTTDKYYYEVYSNALGGYDHSSGGYYVIDNREVA